MTDDELAGRAFDPDSIARVRAILAERWDRDGRIAAAAAVRREPDPVLPRRLDDHAVALCGILAAGGTKAEVVEYLRREEEALLGGVRTLPRELGDVGRRAWLAARGRSEDADGS